MSTSSLRSLIPNYVQEVKGYVGVLEKYRK